jgi:hypothetical protein
MYQTKFNRQFQHFHLHFYMLLIQPLYGVKTNRLQGACCHSPAEMLCIKMLSFERKLQEQTDLCIIHLKIV